MNLLKDTMFFILIYRMLNYYIFSFKKNVIEYKIIKYYIKENICKFHNLNNNDELKMKILL